jgi:transposase
MGKANAAVKGGAVPVRRRRWTKQEKRRIVEEPLVPGASVARVARAHDVNANQVFYRRRLCHQDMLDAEADTPAAPGFAVAAMARIGSHCKCFDAQ